jgi:hypothetical protein
VERSKFFEAQTALADGTVFLVPSGQNGMGVAVITVTREGIRFRALARNQNFGRDAALQPFSSVPKC